jgi:hypothetical protein
MAQFKPGQSGNPAGRKKGSKKKKVADGLSRQDFEALCRSHSQEMLDRLLFFARRDTDGRTAIAAARTIIERGYGQPQTATMVAAEMPPTELSDKFEVTFVRPTLDSNGEPIPRRLH